MAPYLLFIVVGLIVWPFLSWQARLVPGFWWAHVAVATVATFLLVVILPAAIAISVNLSPLAPVAAVVFAFAAILYSLASDATSRGPPLFGIVFCVMMMLPAVALLVTPLQQVLVLFFTGKLEPAAIGALCIGLVMIGLAARQLARVDEDARGDAALRLFLQGWGLKRQGVSPWSDLDSKAFERTTRLTGAERRVGRLLDHARQASSSKWSVVCRWCLGMPAGWRSWLLGLVAVLAIQLAAWPIAKVRIAPSAFLALSGIVWLIVLPVISSIGQFTYHKWLMPFEMTLPVVRHVYFQQTALAFAVSQFRMWSGMCLAFIASLITIRWEPLQPTTLINIILGSALIQVGLFGAVYLLTWLTYRYSLARVGAIVGVFTTVALVFGAMAAPTLNVSLRVLLHHSMWPSVAAGAFAIFGLLLACFTYRRWLITDIN